MLLDGAHNADGAAALAQALDDLAPYLAGGAADPPSPPVIVWASMADKDIGSILGALAASRVVARRHGRVHRARRPARPPGRRPGGGLARRACPARDVLVAADPDAALDLALATGDGPVVVAGSLYLVGAVRGRLVDDPMLRDPVAA